MRAARRVGTMLCGKYRLDRVLGVGGMATVYAATHRAGNRVAVKYLHERFMTDADALTRFRREAYVANRIDHPGALRVLDDDIDEEGGVFLVMPLLEGETVRARWERMGKKLPLEEVVAIALATLDVLAAAHAKGIVHRDIKPENLFLTTDARLFVLDFGIARVLDGPEDASVTRSGVAIGTPAFMAPEQALGRVRDIGPHTDVWAVGATMFTLLTGRFVHLAESASEAMAYAATRAVGPARDAVAASTPFLNAVDGATAYEASARWPDARTMASVLQRAPEAAAARIPLGSPFPHQTPTPSDHGEDVHRAATVAPRSRRTSQRLKNVYAKTGAPRALAAAALATIAVALIPLAYLRLHPRSGTPPHDDGSSSEHQTEAATAQAMLDRARQQIHDAQWEAALANLEKATAIDPTLGGAHLRYVALADAITDDMRRHFSQAQQLRAQLSEEDLSLLEALSPLFQSPADWRATERRLRERSDAHPTDAEAAFFAAQVASRLDDRRVALDLANRTLADDPTYASAFFVIGRANMDDEEHFAMGRDALHHCLDTAPTASRCLDLLTDLDTADGRCEEADNESRNFIALEPSNPLAYSDLARSTYAMTASLEQTRASADAAVARAPATYRRPLQDQLAFGLAVLAGDVSQAESILADWDTVDTPDVGESFHVEILEFSVELDVEFGHKDRATELVREYLNKRIVWLNNRSFDLKIGPWATLYALGAIPRSQFEAERGRWMTKLGVNPLPVGAWEQGYISAVVTKSDAVDALSMRPQGHPRFENLRSEVQLARALVLVGNVAEARARLERATKNCGALYAPIAHTQAFLELGRLLETHDRDRACQAFHVVLQRWGRTAHSTSVEAARAGISRLQCD